MAIETETRLAGPYTGDGSQTVFTFAFKVFQTSDIQVLTSSDGISESVLPSSSYSVTLNSNQDTNPGGSITLTSALASGYKLSITSVIAYLQPMVLTNQGGFYPEVLNTSADRLTILTQQLKTKLDRTIKVPYTSSATADQLLQSIYTARDTAVAKAGEATSAAQSATSAVAGFDAHVAQKEAEITTLVNTKEGEITTFVNGKKAEIEQLATLIEAGWGYVCQEQTWTTDSDISANTEVTIPNNMKYIVGHHHLRLSVDGVQLYCGTNYTEVGTEHQFGTKFKPSFNIASGSVINAWAGSLGSGEIATLITQVATLGASLADLSQRVVYSTDNETTEGE